MKDPIGRPSDSGQASHPPRSLALVLTTPHLCSSELEILLEILSHLLPPLASGCTQIAVVDPESRMFGLHLYDGFLKVVPIDSQGRINHQGKEAFRIRVEEREVRA